MAKASDILGMNARNQQFVRANSSKARKRANSKLLTKRILSKVGIPVPQLYGLIKSREQLQQFDFKSIDTSFVIKPSGGSGGRGILVVRKPKNFTDYWLDAESNHVSEDDLRLHIEDILEGQYSTFGTRHKAFIEERVPVHPTLKKYIYKGTPDIRVVVYNSVPVMAMLRLPTKISGGKANLHQGGLGVGIDIGSGVTLHGVYKNKKVQYLPGTKIKLNGIKIPNWKQILITSVDACNAMEASYVGVDLLLHPDKGAMVIEINARPGLAIQIANQKGLRFRLEKIDRIDIRDTIHGVKVGQALFAERFTDKVKAKDGAKIVGLDEMITIFDATKNKLQVKAAIDTSRYRSTIDRDLANKLGLLTQENILWQTQRSTVIELVYLLKDKRIRTAVSVVKSTRKSISFSVGRKDLQGFLISPDKES